jgi:multiple sugar transport system substrate-binding protein
MAVRGEVISRSNSENTTRILVGNIIGSSNNVVDLRIPGAAEYFDALDTGLAQAVAGQISAKAALDAVAQQWNQITNRLGRDQQKKLYRQMLGLPPR